MTQHHQELANTYGLNVASVKQSWDTWMQDSMIQDDLGAFNHFLRFAHEALGSNGVIASKLGEIATQSDAAEIAFEKNYNLYAAFPQQKCQTDMAEFNNDIASLSAAFAPMLNNLQTVQSTLKTIAAIYEITLDVFPTNLGQNDAVFSSIEGSIFDSSYNPQYVFCTNPIHWQYDQASSDDYVIKKGFLEGLIKQMLESTSFQLGSANSPTYVSYLNFGDPDSTEKIKIASDRGVYGAFLSKNVFFNYHE